jgi:mono/diheme cytochrome c family protein
MLADLRRLTPEKHELFGDIVLGGLFESTGMSGFDDVLTEPEVDAIQAYIVALSREAVTAQGSVD